MASSNSGACTDIGSQSESEVRRTDVCCDLGLALRESLDDDNDWHVDINTFLCAIEVGADISQFIPILGARSTQDTGVKVKEKSCAL